MSKIIFKEVQQIQLSWKWILFIALYILLFWALIEQLKRNTQIEGIVAISFSICCIILFNIIIAIMNLKTEIYKDRICFQYKPFHRKKRTILFSEIDSIKLRTYRPFKEYGGHGLQHGIGKGKSFTVKGNKGIQLVLTNGKQILIGTQKPENVKNVIEKLVKI